MPAAATLLTSGNDTNNGLSSYVTASVAPTANRLLILMVGLTYSSAAAHPTSITAFGLTWVQMTDSSLLTSSRSLTFWRAMGPSPTSGTATINVSATSGTGAHWALVEISGTDTTGTDGSGAIGDTTPGATTGTTIALTMAAPAAGAATLSAFLVNDNVAVSPGSGYTELSDAGFAGPATRFETQFRAAASTTADASWTNSVAVLAFAIEVKVPAAAGSAGGAFLPFL